MSAAPPGPDRGAAPVEPPLDRYALGITLAAFGMLSLSTGGLFVRLIEDAGPWTLLFYRSIGFIIAVFTVVAVRSRGRVVERFANLGWRGMALALVLGVGLVCYVLAIVNASVANVVFVLSSSPVLAAIASWLLLKERISLLTLIIIMGTMAGIAVMVAEGIQLGNALGNMFALITASSFAGMVVLVRYARGFDMLAGTCLAGVFSLAVAAVLAETLVITPRDLMLCVSMGVFQAGIGFTCITYAPRFIPAPEVALVGLVEVVLAPVWVWIGVGETPTVTTLVGGAVVVSFVSTYILRNIIRERRLRS